MRGKVKVLLAGISLLAITAVIAAGFYFNRGTAQASPASDGTSKNSTAIYQGDTAITGGLGDADGTKNESLPKPDDVDMKPFGNGSSGSPTYTPPTNPPNPAARQVTNINEGFLKGFQGLTVRDSRLAGQGIYANTQFTNTPPDQALCVGNGYVVEGVNNAVAVYRQNGTLASGPIGTNQFFGQAPAVDRAHGNVRGPSFSDPVCRYDRLSDRFYLFAFATVGVTSSTQYFAVTNTGDPTGSWSVYSYSTTDDGTNGTPNHAGCPCLGDYQQVGIDRNGIYVTTNEFGLNPENFVGAQIYAISKKQLLSHAHTVSLVHIENISAPDSEQIAPFTIIPASRARGDFDGDDSDNQRQYKGIEYFESTPFFFDNDSRVVVWALTNTNSLNGSTPTVSLQHSIVGTEVYSFPNDVTQKAPTDPSQTPYKNANAPTAPLQQLAGNDFRMTQVVFAQGNLWSAVETSLANGHDGVAFFKIRPIWPKTNQLKPRVVDQGYVAVAGNDLLFPSVGVSADDQGVIAFSLAGPDYFPSAAYIRVDDRGIFGKVHVAAAGIGPDDDFSGYPTRTTSTAGRWGDYSAAVAAADGTIWIANEYIGPIDRSYTSLGNQLLLAANWSTFIAHISTDTDD